MSRYCGSAGRRSGLRAPVWLLFWPLAATWLAPSRWSGSQGQKAKSICSDVTSESGIRWAQFNGESADRFLIEAMGGGVALLDFDGDGLLDILFINGGETPHAKSPIPVRNALYRNLGNGRFEDVAGKAGIDRLSFYEMGRGGRRF